MAGILIASFLEISIYLVCALTLSFFVVYVLFWRLLRKYLFFKHHWLLGILGGLCIVLLGYLHAYNRMPENKQNHLVNVQDQISAYTGVISRPPEERANTIRYQFEVTKIRQDSAWRHAKALVHLYLPKSALPFHYGDVLLIKGSPTNVRPPQNPFEFDYRHYLWLQGITHQHFLKNGFKKIGEESPNMILNAGFEMRKWAAEHLSQSMIDTNAKTVAQALVLGLKNDLNNELKEAYSASGAMHVLAVSGLHVGIIYGVVLLMFKPFRKSLITRWLKALVSLMVLWGFAMLTGFSPSVLRAVTMFSFVVIAEAANRQTNIYNTLAASALVLLLIDPMLVHAVGFQLSYLAVLGIVYLQPKIYAWFYTKNWLLDKVWAITAVSLAAQIATAPLSMYYFHQFPTVFLLTNLVVIPGATFILVGGLATVATAALPVVNSAIGWALEAMIKLMNNAVFILEAIPYATISAIEISAGQCFLIIGCILFLLAFLNTKKLWVFAAMVFTLGLIVLGELNQSLSMNRQEKLIIYDTGRKFTMDLVRGQHVFTLSTAPATETNFQTAGWRMHHQMQHQEPLAIDSLIARQVTYLHYGGHRFAFLRNYIQRNFQLPERISIDFLIIGGQFNRSISWILDRFDPETIILDASMPMYRERQLINELEKHGINEYALRQEGAFEMNLKEDYELRKIRNQ